MFALSGRLLAAVLCAHCVTRAGTDYRMRESDEAGEARLKEFGDWLEEGDGGPSGGGGGGGGAKKPAGAGAAGAAAKH